MAEKNKTLAERHADEVLSNNAALDKCRQCKDCAFRDDGTVWSNHYQKGCCEVYRYPNSKPFGVMLNTEFCEFYMKDKG